MPLPNAVLAGGNQITGWPAGWERRDVYDNLTKLDTARKVPFDQLLRASSLVKTAKQVKQEYFRRDATIPTASLTVGASAGNLAGATQTITVANAAIFLNGDVVQYQAAGNIRFIGQITAINYTTNLLTIGTLNLAADTSNPKSANAFGAGAIAAAALPLLRISSARGERDAPPDTNRNISVAAFNLVQSFAVLVDDSTHAMKSDNYTEREGQVYHAEKRESYRRDINKALYVGRKGVTLRNGKYVWTFDGLQAHALPQFGYTTGTLTENQAVDIGYAVGVGNSGSQTRIMLCGSLVSKDFDKIFLAKLQNTESKRIAGMEMTGIKTGPVTIMKMFDPTLDDLGMANKGFIVDPAYMARADMEAYNEAPIDGRETGTFDGKAIWGQEKFCPLFTMPEAFMEVTANA